jgi:acylphosphatase
MKKEVYCVVHGAVQGVLFRKFAQDRAREFGVTGYAKNLDDGSVEVVAQGEEAKVREFVEKISAGPESAEVESLNIMWGPISEEFSSFDIL